MYTLHGRHLIGLSVEILCKHESTRAQQPPPSCMYYVYECRGTRLPRQETTHTYTHTRGDTHAHLEIIGRVSNGAKAARGVFVITIFSPDHNGHAIPTNSGYKNVNPSAAKSHIIDHHYVPLAPTPPPHSYSAVSSFSRNVTLITRQRPSLSCVCVGTRVPKPFHAIIIL